MPTQSAASNSVGCGTSATCNGLLMIAMCFAGEVVGSFRDPAAVRAFAEGVDVLTVEIEHVDVEAMQQVCVARPVDASTNGLLHVG